MASLVNTTTLEIRRSANTVLFSSPWTVLSEAAADAAEAIPRHFRKWNGAAVVEMTQLEKDGVLGQFEVDRQARELAAYDAKDILRATILVMLDEVNLLRANAGLAQRTPAQARTAIVNKLAGLT